MFYSEEKSKLYSHLLDIGCCRKCCLRYLCDKTIEFDDTDSFHVNDVKQQIKAEDESDNVMKKPKPNACIVCLGLLQEFTLEDILNNKFLSNVDLYDSEVFTCSISVPACVLLREKAMRLYLEDTFPSMFKDDTYEIPLNRAWKSFVKSRLSKHLGKKFENSEICDFSINVNMDYYSNEDELDVLQRMQPAVFDQRRTQHRKFSGGLYSRKGVMGALERTPSGVFKAHYTLPPQVPYRGLFCKLVECKHNSVYIAGRYCKYSRELSQSPWIIDGVKTMETSIHELIFAAVTEQLGFSENNLVFAASGREDIDVRCLGNGRPFYVEITDPQKTKFTFDEFRTLEKKINLSGLIEITDLQQVQKSELKYIKEGEETKTKEYNALCVCSQPVTSEHLEKLQNYGIVELAQKTPIRVLHRRPLAVRKKCIYKMEARTIPDNPNLLDLTMVTQAGTYVKEFVHGDFGRTKPSVCDILDMEVDIAALDVTAVNLDWPKRINYGAISDNKELITDVTNEIGNIKEQS